MTGLWRFVRRSKTPANGVLSRASDQESLIHHTIDLRKSRPPEQRTYVSRRKEESLPEPLSQEAEERLKLAIAAADIGTWDLDVFSNALRSCSRCTAILGSPLDTRN